MHLYEFLDQLLTATAWKMNDPPSYGVFHLTFLTVGLILSVFAAWRLRKLGDKGNRILLLSVGIFLMVAEVYKQLFYYFYMEDGSYAWWIFPFQLCSVPMYMCVIAPLLKPGRVQKSMYNFMMIYNLLGGFISFLEPSGLLHGYLTLTLHSCTWHMLLVFVGLYLCFSGRAGFEMKDYRSATGTFLLLCVVAFCINLIFWDVSGGTINMFFIGPKNSPLIVFSDIAEAFGWYVGTALYIPSVCLGAFLIFLPMHHFGLKRQKACCG